MCSIIQFSQPINATNTCVHMTSLMLDHISVFNHSILSINQWTNMCVHMTSLMLDHLSVFNHSILSTNQCDKHVCPQDLTSQTTRLVSHTRKQGCATELSVIQWHPIRSPANLDHLPVYNDLWPQILCLSCFRNTGLYHVAMSFCDSVRITLIKSWFIRNMNLKLEI